MTASPAPEALALSDVPMADRRFPELVRYSYLEELLGRRRVLVVGALGAGSCERIAELGARWVLGVDDDEERIALLAVTSTAQVEYRAMSPEALDLRDRSFDVVVFPDLSVLDEPDGALAEARRVLAEDGVAIVALSNREAALGLAGAEPPRLGYAELWESCAAVFPTVRMVGQSPFVGYSLADFTPADEEPGICFDAALMPDEGEEVEFYLAICSERPIEIDAYAIIQIPLGSVVPREVEGRPGSPDLRADLERERELSVERSIKAQRLEHELKAMEDEARKARDRAARFAKELDDEKKARQRAELEGAMVRRSPELTELRERVAALTVELEEQRSRPTANDVEVLRKEKDDALSALAARAELLRDQGTRLDECERSLRQVTTDLEARGAELRDLESRLAGTPSREDHDALREKARALAEELSGLDAAIAAADSDRGADVSRLERELGLRSRRVEELEAEVARREGIVRDLCAQLEELAGEPGDPGEVPSASSDADALEQARTSLERAALRAEDAEGRLAVAMGMAAERDARIAALEDERQACLWRISELEGQVRFSRPVATVVDADVAAAMARGYRLRVAELESELAEALAKAEAVVAEANSKSALAGTLSTELEAVRNRSILLEGELCAAQDAAGKFDAQAALAERLGAELEAARNRTVLLEGELDACRRRVDELDAERHQTLERLNEVEGRFGASEADASFARQIATAAQEEVLELRSILSIRDGQLGEARQALADQASRSQELGVELARLHDEMAPRTDSDRAALEATRARLDTLEAELEFARQGSAVAETRMRAHEATVVALRSELDDARQEAGRLATDLEGARARLSEIDDRLEPLDAARREALARAKSAEEREQEGAQAVRRLMEEIDAQRIRLREALERGDVLLAELQARQSDVVDARRQKEIVEVTSADLRRRLEAVTADLDQLRARGGAIEAEGRDARYRVEARERELDEVRGKLSTLEGDFRAARTAAEDRARELNAARQRLTEADRTAAELRAAAERAQELERELDATRQELAEAERTASELRAAAGVVRERQEEAAAAWTGPNADARDAEISRLRDQIRGLEQAAEEMAARGAAAIADADERATVAIERLTRQLEDARQSGGDAFQADLARVSDELARAREEAAGHELLMRSLMAQVEERDGRLLVLERRSAEEAERAGAALRAAQDQIARMADDLGAARGEGRGASDGAAGSRDLLESVRRELMRLSEDGRAQPLWDELRALLRQFPKGS